MANAGCINAYDCNGCLIQTLQNLDSACIGVGVQYTAPNPLDDKRLDYIKYTDKCGCVQCLSGENEILIYATDGVIKDLTLTNDDVNEAIKIQWNDIFGSNRAKTIVRYKTGSYPVSITDGTLAVEETTKNQYSSTPFSLSGVLDETTYYISAFAVDSNGTIIDVQTNQITTSFFLSKYQAVEYIGMNGNNEYTTPYIRTGFTPNNNTTVEVKLLWNQNSNNSCIFCARAGGTDRTFSCFNIVNRLRQDYYSTQAELNKYISTNTQYVIKVDKNKFYVDSSLINTISAVSFSAPYPMTIGSSYMTYSSGSMNMGNGFNGRFYYFKIRDNGTLVRDFVPAYRKSDNVIGFIDKVSKTFFTNSGNGTFSKGSNVPR